MHDWTPEQKKEALLAGLERGKVRVLANMRTEGIDLPPGNVLGGIDASRRLGLAGTQWLPLMLSWRYERIDLRVDDFGISATLSFKGSTVWHRCKLPWASVELMETEDGALLPKPRLKLKVV